MKIVILGLSVTSSWGNGHATTYRGLLGGLASRGHEVLFLERDMPWYANTRDLPQTARWTTELYSGLKELKGLTRLRTLDLRGSKVTKKGIAELQKELPKLKIKH